MKPQIHTLPNGLRVLILDTKSFPTLTMLLLVGAGSRYENEKNNGIAHFLEHMFYKGSKNYPDMEIISEEIEGMGGHWNAFTSKDYTGYFIKAATYHFPKMADILSDILLRPLLKTEEIEKEKGVIVEEINMYEDTPQRRIADIFENVMYEGSPLGYDIAGTKKTVTSFDRNTFVSYMESLYQPQNAVLVVAGGLSGAGDVLKTVEAKFSHWNRGKAAGYSAFDSKQTSPRLKIANKQTEQAHFCVGFPTFGIKDDRRPILRVLATVMGGGASSRLFQEVREKRGLCYYISQGIEQYKDTGNLVTQAGVAKNIDKVKEALSATMKEHGKIIKGQIKDTDIARSKEMIKGRMLLSLEDSFNVAHFFGLKELHENVMETPEDIMKKIDKVTREEIVTLAGEIFTHDNLNFSIIGPFEKEVLSITDLEY